MKKVTVAIIRSPLKGYEDVKPEHRPWTKRRQGNVGIDTSIYLYIKTHYPMIDIRMVSLNTATKQTFDFVFAGTEMYANGGWIRSHMPKKAESIFEKLKKVKNMYPSYEFIQFMSDKCEYSKKLKAPFTPTHCLSPQNKEGIKEVAKRYNGDVFIKPAWGSESIDLYTDKSHSLSKYLNKMAQKNYHLLIVQPKRVFCTECNPEIKAYFVGTKFSYAIGMKWGGETIRFYSKLPDAAMKVAVSVLKQLQKYESTIVNRVDMYKHKGEYFINEIEISPSIATEDIENIKDWNFDVHVGDRIVELLSMKMKSEKKSLISASLK